ncbi:MAG: glycine/betaine transporter [Aeromicrobium sp.]|nr:glycine/betaine transporter [Aeromicrobium sp.]
MSHTRTKLAGAAAVASLALMLSACGGDPTESKVEDTFDGTVTIGSAGFPESEIIAEIYGQALAAKGIKVEQKPSIGEREVYFKALEDGSIDLVPDYTGNLLTYVDPETTAKTSEEIDEALDEKLPKGIEVLDASPAEDKDSYNVTPETSDKLGITTIADLKKIDGLKLAGPPPLAERVYGVPGLEKVYGITGVKFTPIKDGGGPTTLKALLDGKADVVDIFTTTPSIADNKLVTLEDPENLIIPQNIVPLIAASASSDEVQAVLDKVSAALTTDDLVDLNRENGGDGKVSPQVLAKKWLTDKGLI